MLGVNLVGIAVACSEFALSRFHPLESNSLGRYPLSTNSRYLGLDKTRVDLCSIDGLRE